GVASGEGVLTAALVEPDGDDPLHPATAARRDGARWRLDGTKTCVPAAHLAARVLVPARTAAGEAALFLVDPRGAGVRVERQTATNREPLGHLTLAGADAEGLAGGGAALAWLVEHATVALCAIQVRA